MAALGGALVLGALPRIKEYLRIRDVLCLGIGMALLFNSTAISAAFDIDMSCVRVRAMERDSGASGRAVNTSTGLPCQAAL